MPIKSQSAPKLNHHNRIMLSPIKKSKKKKILQDKQKKFVLDCTNHSKSKLQEYNYLKDKYLNYCIVKVPRKKRIIMNASNHLHSQPKQQKSLKSPLQFKNFLENKRAEILAQTELFQSPKKQNNFFQQEPQKRPLKKSAKNIINEDEKQNIVDIHDQYN